MNAHVPKKAPVDFNKLKGGTPCTQDGRPLLDARPRITDLPSVTVQVEQMPPLPLSNAEAQRQLFEWVDRAVDEENAKDIIMEVSKPKTAVDILRNAADLLEERGKQYDSPGGERSMGKAVAAFNAITGRSLTVEEGWLLLGLVKDVRQYTSGKRHEDSAIDGVAYAALEAETILEQLSKGGFNG